MSQILVLNQNLKRETGRKAQMSNIAAAKAVAEIVRTCLGPRAMLKMVLDAMGGVVLTNDGNAILREIDVNHPAAKSMIELCRAQDENVGDGTTSVIILAGEVLQTAEPWLEKGIHPLVIIGGYVKALEDATVALEKYSVPLDLKDRNLMLKIVNASLGTKFIARWGDFFAHMAIEAVQTVYVEENGRKDVDIKRYIRVEKIPGGEVNDSFIVKGAVLNKDVVHPKMKRRVENPRILLLDCPLEYKKAESMLNIEVGADTEWSEILRQEEEYIIKLCNEILKFKPDVVVTEKGLSDLAAHIFVKHGVTALRRAKKTDNNRIARACGATIVSRTDEIQESDIGTGAGLFEVRKIGDEYYSYIEQCKDPKACTVVLRGPNKDVLNEIDRNLSDAFNVVRNIIIEPRLVPGGGAIEMAISQHLLNKAGGIEGVQQWTYRGIANALEIIPKTLTQNCGAKVVKLLTELRAKHASNLDQNYSWGIDGMKGTICDVKTLDLWEPVAVKAQTIKSAIEQACLLLRVDEVVSGMKKKGGQQAPNAAIADEDAETKD